MYRGLMLIGCFCLLLVTACGIVDITEEGEFFREEPIVKFYYSGGEKVTVTSIPNKILIYTKDFNDINEIINFVIKLKALDSSFEVKIEYINQFSAELQNRFSKIDRDLLMSSLPEIEHIGNAWYSSLGGEIMVGNEFHVALSPGYTEEDLIEYNKIHNVKIALKIELLRTQYTLRFKWDGNRDVFDLCVEYYNSGMFGYVTPDILIHKIP